MIPERELTPMTKEDRCDRCGAEAIHRFVSEATGLDLILCNHHTGAHLVALEKAGFRCVESKEMVRA